MAHVSQQPRLRGQPFYDHHRHRHVTAGRVAPPLDVLLDTPPLAISGHLCRRNAATRTFFTLPCNALPPARIDHSERQLYAVMSFPPIIFEHG